MCWISFIFTAALSASALTFPDQTGALKAIQISSHGQLLRSDAGRRQHWRALHQQGERGAGAVCSTWQRQDIQNQSLKPYLRHAGVDAEAFLHETLERCKSPSDSRDYTGSWNDIAPSEDDVYILQNLTTWLKQPGNGQNKSWSQFAKSDNGTRISAMVHHALTVPTPVHNAGEVRALDFGCGSGDDLKAIKNLLKTSKADSLCVDIFPVSSEDLTSIVLNSSSDAAYKTSLDNATVGNENTVHVAISMVTFHHIPRHQMRRDALEFIRRVLHPDGVFIIAEWDNSVYPNRWIQFDLIHVLNMMIFFGGAPEKPDDLKIGGTEYLSVHNWIQAFEHAGLTYDSDRSLTNRSGRMLNPVAVANLPDPQRDFTAVFRKS